MWLYNRIIIVLTKAISCIIRLLHIGAGATWPGEIALRLNPQIFDYFITQNPSVILVAGTNGKTTTVKMLETILTHAGLTVHHNESGANLDNGIISGFIDDTHWYGRLRSTIHLFEVDEATLPVVIPKLQPSLIILLNLFRDQLDRYGEVDTIAQKWQQALRILNKNTHVIINADDPHLAYIGSQLKSPVLYFGLEDPSLYIPAMQHATDTIYCPKCGQRLTFAGLYFSHLGKWACGKCGLTHPEVAISAKDVVSPLEGVYNIYNTLAATLAAKTLGIEHLSITRSLQNFLPAFGRQESLTYHGKRIKLLLSKNPTGFNESIRTIMNSKLNGPMLLVLNDRIPDGKDVSWIWDVDFEELKEHGLNGYSRIERIVVSGDRCFDLGLRLKYAGVNQIQNSKLKNQKLNPKVKNIFEIEPSLNRAIEHVVGYAKVDQTVWILPTYSAMLDVRKIVTGKKIL